LIEAPGKMRSNVSVNVKTYGERGPLSRNEQLGTPAVPPTLDTTNLTSNVEIVTAVTFCITAVYRAGGGGGGFLRFQTAGVSPLLPT
jgi:hypothetical protein